MLFRSKAISADGAVFIAPPIAFMDMAFLPRVPRLKLIAVGDEDELCPVEQLEALLASRPAAAETPVAVRIIAGADHFFGGGEEELFRLLRDFPL